ncbi:phosphotransferase [Pseudoalteromonas sp. XMcav1-K]|uniref:phosphotransferase n=1 Tax=Pseudoalteromonas sp. XMcav1-K TaxID=3374372 RepID=UPI003756EBC9
MLNQCQDYLVKLGLEFVAKKALYLTQGVNNTCFRVETQCGKTLLLKHFDRENNFKVTLVEQHLAKEDVVPNVIATSEKHKLIAYQFIESVEFNKPLHLQSLVAKLVVLHNLNSDYDYEEINLSTLFSSYIELAEYKNYQTTINQLLAKLKNYPYELGVCHNDLVRENLIFSNKTSWLIDFEYVGLNDVYFDLAALCSSLTLNLSDKKYLLACYFKLPSVSSQQLEKLDLYQQLYNLICYLWYLKHGFTSHAQVLKPFIND